FRRVLFRSAALRGPSIVERMLEVAPALRPTAQGSPVYMLSSFDEHVGAGTPVCAPDQASLEAVADGVPARFPLHYAHFFWGPVPALQLATDPRPSWRTAAGPFPETAGAEIALATMRDTPRRDLRLSAGV